MPHVVFLMSDTGAGHRASASAMGAALEQRYPGRYTFDLIDVFRRYGPFPFQHLPEIYPRWVNWASATWAATYHLSNQSPLDRALVVLAYQWLRRGLRRMLTDHPADVLVGAHGLLVRPVLRALNEQTIRPPFVTVVTDLVSTHTFWYARQVDRCLVPTPAAYERGLRCGLTPDQLRVTGLPVHPHFAARLIPRSDARRKLGLAADLPAVLLVGGGDGMGPLYRIAGELNRRRLPMQLIIIAGRNQRLRRRLATVQWNQPTHVFPFVDNMPEFMAAVDILVTKAGPTTVSEACLAGLPMVLSGAVPGQEAGNITFVVDHGAGTYAPGPRRTADAVARWLNGSYAELADIAANARQAGFSDAAWTIAEEIHLQAQRGPVPTRAQPLQSRR